MQLPVELFWDVDADLTQQQSEAVTEWFSKYRQRIKMRLPHGAIRIIGAPMSLSNTTVDRALQAGWTDEYHPGICRRAMLLIAGAGTDPDMVRDWVSLFEPITI